MSRDLHRLAISLLLSAALLGGMFLVRPYLDFRLRETGISPDEFWIAKFNAPPEFDVAVGGDSPAVLDGEAGCFPWAFFGDSTPGPFKTHSRNPSKRRRIGNRHTAHHALTNSLKMPFLILQFGR